MPEKQDLSVHISLFTGSKEVSEYSCYKHITAEHRTHPINLDGHIQFTNSITRDIRMVNKNNTSMAGKFK